MTQIDVDKCKMTHYPAAVLGRPSEPVETIDDNLGQLIAKMVDIMIENKGMGLAAPQAGVELRLFIISMDGSRESVRVYINPTVTTSGDLDEKEEETVKDITGAKEVPVDSELEIF